MTELNTIIDVSYNQQLRRIYICKTNSKMPSLQKRNSSIRFEFNELAMMHVKPDKVIRLLLSAAIFTQCLQDKYKHMDSEALYACRGPALKSIASTTLTRKVFDHHATLGRTISCLTCA